MKSNIALIGFMGSGKTTVGRILAKKLAMIHIDSDKEIMSATGKSIDMLFKEQGEQGFRNIEYQTIKDLSELDNVIISTGGGVILDAYNIKNLSKSSFIVYLDCDIDCILERVMRRTHRPLVNVENPEVVVRNLFEKRKKLYELSCDFRVKISKEDTLNDTVEAVKKAYIHS